ncbi:glutathione S-transferase family protein [Roseobacter sp. HKCCA0434]|uniref:glutathione S-transferase family protein n=1 Tax=Roseobacter sp. HKCCA0434 TaxID=3079297 RepID=UPI002905A923|nr:glutathione S-transferase family protein [Roseobacter sp. HKCCA0434]
MSYHLYWMSGAPPVWRVMLALNLKKIRYTETRVTRDGGELNEPSFGTINPRRQVPVLMTPEGPVRESIAILAYLDRVKPTPALFGRSPAEAGVIWQWIMDYENHLRGAMVTMSMIAFRGEAEARAGELSQALDTGCAEMETILHRLRLMPWLGGADISAADIVFYPGVQWMRKALARLEPGPLHEMMENPALIRWEKQIEKLPKFAQTVPPHWAEGDPKNLDVLV